MPVKMASNKLVDFLFIWRMEVLKLVEVPCDIEAIRGYDIGFAFDKMFSLLTSDLWDGGKTVWKMGRRSLNTISRKSQIYPLVKNIIGCRTLATDFF